MKKKKIELNSNVKILFVYCSQCHKYQIALVDNLEKQDEKDKRKKIKISIISCNVCKIVQNLSRIPKIKKIKYSEVKKKLNNILYKYE